MRAGSGRSIRGSTLVAVGGPPSFAKRFTLGGTVARVEQAKSPVLGGAGAVAEEAATARAAAGRFAGESATLGEVAGRSFVRRFT